MGRFSSLAKSVEKNNEKVVFKFIAGKYENGTFFVRKNSVISIGRDISSDVAIVDSKVSRHHATIRSENDKVFISDNDSTNGTFINGKKIASTQFVEIKPDDEVSIGDSIFTLISNATAKNHSEMKKKESVSEIKKASSMETIMPDFEDEDEFDLGLDLPEKAVDDSLETPKTLGKVALTKKVIANANAKKNPQVASNSGDLSKINPVDLLKLLSTSQSSIGKLLVKMTSPLKETIEFEIGKTGILSCKSKINPDFSEEKILARYFFALEGSYVFKEDFSLKDKMANKFLEDLFMEIASKQSDLPKIRKIIKSGFLRFAKPITGKLSSLSPKQLDSLQFMVNTEEVEVYLNMFPDLDDFLLLSEILKFVEEGFLFGDNNETVETSQLPDDIMDF